MGLDMYLYKRTFVDENHKKKNVKGRIQIRANCEPISIKLGKVTHITELVGYWRKVNQIHNWFVDQIQEGKDDIRHEWHVPYEKLMELKSVCEKVIETKDVSLLPTRTGLFFGPINFDELYFKELKYTINLLNNMDKDCSYYYKAFG